MKKMLLLYCVLSIFFGCSSSKHTAAKDAATMMNSSAISADGSSFENAVIIKETNENEGVNAEYKWLKENYPGYSMEKQSMDYHKQKPYDILYFKTSDGTEKIIYFNISNFYGKL